MNKKGFTLVELLAVIALLALLTGIAVPNIISTINNNKKNTFLMDAKRMVSKASYLLSNNPSDRETVLAGNRIIYNFNDLNEDEEFLTDADGGSYDANTFVMVTLNSGSYNYCICAVGSKRQIGSSCNATTGSGCVSSTTLTGIDVVKDK